MTKAIRRITSIALSLAMLFSVMLAGAGIGVSAATYDWGSLLKKSADWYGSSEGTKLADEIVQYQLSDGGWKKDMSGSTSGSWAKSTIDNDATTSQITVLARVYNQTKNAKYLDACLRGIDLLINGQYGNGGWPQVFNDAGTYHAHITYNDGAMIHVLNIMSAVSAKSGDFTFIDSSRASRAANAVEKGIRCILDTQIVVNGTKTAWCQQHDEKTLAPAPARAYELPSISASESVGIVNFLKGLSNPSAEITSSINAAVKWMTDVQINGIKVVASGDDKIVVQDASASPIWARFYEIGTNTPMFVDRDGSIHYAMAELSQERRTGYAWYGTWPSSLVKAGYVEDVEPPVLEGTLICALTVSDTANASDWSIQNNLSVGDKIYGDRDFTLAKIANAVSGAEWIRTACDSKSYSSDLAKFTAGGDISVYIAVDTRNPAIPSWLGDWTKLTDTLADSAATAIEYMLYKKDFARDAQITLGSNGSGTGCVGYFVAVTEQKAAPQPYIKGDLNNDGSINAADVALMKNGILYGFEDTLAKDAAELDANASVDGNDLKLLTGFVLGSVKAF